MISFLVGLGVGFAAGWVVFERPDWATKLIARARLQAESWRS